MGVFGSRISISWFTAAVCVLICFYYYHSIYNRATIEIELGVEQPSTLKIYWTNHDQLFSEKNRAMIRINPETQNYSFFLTDLADIHRLRIDPFEYVGSGSIGNLTLSQKGYDNLTVDLSESLDTNNISAQSSDGEKTTIRSDGIDPYFIIEPEKHKQPVNRLAELIIYICICLFIILTVKGCSPLQKNYGFVPVLLAVILTLVVVMATVSKRNAHPDEYVHLEASAYYQHHILPPAIESDEIKHTYSAYGISRLNNGEIYYLLVGKFSHLLKVLHIDNLLALRAFNIFLFGLIFLYSVKSVEARLVALPFLLSPQIWYVFSYCVSDAFGLFLCFLAGCEIARKDSFLNRMLDSRPGTSPFLPVTMVALLLSLLLLLKINYYPFILLLYSVIFWRWITQREGRQRIFVRVVVCTLLAILFAGLRIGSDYYVNGLDSQQKILAMQEERAHHWYKPSTELHKKHVSMFMKERGITLKEMIIQHKWFAHTFETGFGKYGYFTIGGSETYYHLMKWCAILFLIVVYVAVLIKGDLETRLQAILVAALAAALIVASVHRSWTVDFQAQGRYLFPLFPMLGVLIAKTFSTHNSRVLTLTALHLFLLSFYSYVFIALPAIPRSF